MSATVCSRRAEGLGRERERDRTGADGWRGGQEGEIAIEGK